MLKRVSHAIDFPDYFLARQCVGYFLAQVLDVSVNCALITLKIIALHLMD